MARLVILALVALTSACSASGGAARVRASTITYDVVSGADNLQLLNLGDPERLKDRLQGSLAIDVKALWFLAKTSQLTPAERRSAFASLRLVAVQNEKFPVPGWEQDAELQKIFAAAIAEDPAHAAEVRARNWSKPWWMD